MKYGMVKITPLDTCRREKFIRPAHRLIKAWERQHRSFHERHFRPDIYAEYEAVAAWGYVTCSYSGIEQAIKCLLQMRKAFIDKGLCKACYERLQGKGSEECSGTEKCGNKEHYPELFHSRHNFAQTLGSERNHRHHYIGKLFRALAPEEQDVLRDSYAIFCSLHDYIPPGNVDCFLNAIDDGYPSWRYCLLEGEKPPTTHPGAMLEIWSALKDILQARVFKNHGLESAEKRITDSLNRKLQRDPHELIDLNKCIGLFLKIAEQKMKSEDFPDPDEKELSTLVEDVEKYLRDDAKEEWIDNDLVYFIHRAGRGEIAWNTETKLFEKVSLLEEVNIRLIVPDYPYVESFILGPSVAAERIESVPPYIEDFIFRPRPELVSNDADWSAEVEVGKELAEFEDEKAEIEEYEGEDEFEAYTCHVGGIRLILVLYDSKEWFVYEYHNGNVPAVPPHCRRIGGKLSTLREAIREIKHWRSAEPETLEVYQRHLWKRRGKRTGRVRSP